MRLNITLKISIVFLNNITYSIKTKNCSLKTKPTGVNEFRDTCCCFKNYLSSDF